MILPAWRGYPFFRQRGSYLERRLPKQKHPVDPLDQFRLFGVDHEVAVGPHVVAEEPFERNGHLAVSEPLSLTPGAVLRDRTAFFLGKRGHDGQQKFAFAVERPDVLFLEIDLNAMLLQLADGGEAVDRVAGEMADRLCDDQVDLPGEGVGHHAFEALTLFGVRPGDALVGCCTKRTNKFMPYRIPGVRSPSEL